MFQHVAPASRKPTVHGETGQQKRRQQSTPAAIRRGSSIISIPWTQAQAATLTLEATSDPAEKRDNPIPVYP